MVDIPIRNEGYIKAREKAVVAIDTASIDETVKQQLLRLDRGMPWYEPVVSVRWDDATLEYFLPDNACVRIRCRVGVGARKPKAVQAKSALLTVSFSGETLTLAYQPCLGPVWNTSSRPVPPAPSRLMKARTEELHGC